MVNNVVSFVGGLMMVLWLVTCGSAVSDGVDLCAIGGVKRTVHVVFLVVNLGRTTSLVVLLVVLVVTVVFRMLC